MSDTTATLVHTASRFFSGTLISRFTGLLRDITLAYTFGASGSLAAFMIAFRFAHLLRRVLGEGALQSAFIPHFEELRHHSTERAYNFFSNICVVLFFVLSSVVLITASALYFGIRILNLTQDHIQILTLTLILLPSLLPICFYGLNSALLQCEKRYFIAGVAPVAFNLTLITGCFIVRDLPSPMPWLAGFAILACLFQWLVTLPSINFSLTHVRNLKKEIRPIVLPFTLGITGVAATQINNAIDPLFARWAALEGPAYLWYAIRLQQLPLALFGIALSGALLPPLSRASKRGDQELFHHLLNFSIRKSLLLMVPMTALLLITAPYLIDLIYGYGAFGPTAELGTTRCLQGYAFGLIPQTLVLLFAPSFYAQKNYRIPTSAAILCTGSNLVFNSIFIFYLHLGPESVAYATSISSLVQALFLGYFQLNQIRKQAS